MLAFLLKMDALGGRITVLRALSFSFYDIVNGLGLDRLGRRRWRGCFFMLSLRNFCDMYGDKAKEKGEDKGERSEDSARRK